jgi:hypothetical protein
MDWWQYVLLYLGIWLLGFFTGMQSGMAMAMARLMRPAPPPQAAAGMPDMAALTAMLGAQQGRGQ